MAARMPMMAITIINSINVKPFSLFLVNFLNIFSSLKSLVFAFDHDQNQLNLLTCPSSPPFLCGSFKQLIISLPNLYTISMPSLPTRLQFFNLIENNFTYSQLTWGALSIGLQIPVIICLSTGDKYLTGGHSHPEKGNFHPKVNGQISGTRPK